MVWQSRVCETQDVRPPQSCDEEWGNEDVVKVVEVVVA